MSPGINSNQRPHIVKPDYSIWHHGMEMTYSYGYSAAHRYMTYYYLLHDTPAALNAQTAEGIIAHYADLFTKQGKGSYMGSRGLGPGAISSYSQILAYAAISNIDLAKSVLKAFLNCEAISLKIFPEQIQKQLTNNVINNFAITP